MSSTSNTTHYCHDHYELKSEETHFSCDGCKMNGFGPRYACLLCGDKLHKECRNPKPTISHDFFGCSNFSFIQKPFVTNIDEENQSGQVPAPNYCNACGTDICGFSYHCEARNLNLHPCCRNLEKFLKFDDVVFNLKPNLSSKCYCCDDDESVIKDNRGWSYVSSCKKYHFHVYCLMDRVHLAKIKKGEVDKSDVLMENDDGSNFFEENIKPLLLPLIDILLEVFGKHGVEVLKKVTVTELLLLLVKKCLINESTRERIGLFLGGCMKQANSTLDKTSLHDLFKAVKKCAAEFGNKLFSYFKSVFNFIADSVSKLVKRKDLVPVAEGIHRMV